MPNRLTRSLVGACALVALLLLLPSAAAAAAPATVSVRIEGAGATLLPRTTVTTTTSPVVKDGNPVHSCSGTSAAGALERATGGVWGASWSDGLGYFVTSLKGEAPPDASSYFSLWVNEHRSPTGICDTELQDGDRVLFFLDRCDYNAQTQGCTNAPVMPLGLSAPERAGRGQPFAVKVVRYAADGMPAPVAGATVSGGSVPALTGADGTAQVTAADGDAALLRASKDGFARSDAVRTTLCARLGGDGSCLSDTGTVIAPPPTPDRAPPVARLTSVHHNQVFRLRRGPRELRGAVAADPSGLARVALVLTGRDRGRCSWYDGARERFRAASCRRNPARAFGVGDRADWSYLLPGRLPRGRWLLSVIATDRAGNRSVPVDRVTRIAVYVGVPRPRRGGPSHRPARSPRSRRSPPRARPPRPARAWRRWSSRAAGR